MANPRGKGTRIGSASLKDEEWEFLEAQGHTLTSWSHFTIEYFMNNGAGLSIDDELLQLCYLKFKKQVGSTRTLEQTLDWLKSPSWKEELNELNMKAASFLNYVIKKLYQEGASPNRLLHEYVIENLLAPGEVAQPYKIQQFTEAESKEPKRQAELAKRWVADQLKHERDNIEGNERKGGGAP